MFISLAWDMCRWEFVGDMAALATLELPKISITYTAKRQNAPDFIIVTVWGINIIGM